MSQQSFEKGKEANREGFISGFKNRVLQLLACYLPGARTWRVWLHRWRGVHIGKHVWIGYDAIIETSSPELVTIRDRARLPVDVLVVVRHRIEGDERPARALRPLPQELVEHLLPGRRVDQGRRRQD